MAERGTGLALALDPDGTIREVLVDEVGLGASLTPGARFRTAVAAESAEPVDRMLEALGASGRAFGRELSFRGADGEMKLRCHAVALGQELLVVAEDTGTSWIESLQGKHDQRLQELRAEAGGELDSCDPPASLDADLFEDFSRLNNELANLQRAMAKKNAELERINQHKNQLLGMAAHDLRDPIAVIVNISYCLKEMMADHLDDRQRQLLGQIERNSTFMSELIDDILEIVNIESGELHLRPVPTDLAMLVRESLDLHQALAGRKQMRLVAEIEESLPTVTLDRSKFEQILNNLISNAIKFSHPATSIAVRLRRHNGQGGVLLEVADQGQGIPETELQTIFEPFQRTSVRPTAGEKSTGLGLAIVKRIVEGHNGRISVDSAVGRGSTFKVELPIQV